jgi:hypothetical protein
VLQEESKNESQTQGVSEELNFDKPSYSFIPKGNHEWRQQGFFLICKSCEIEHATHIGPDKLLVGFNEKNEPILEDRKKFKG